MEVQTTAPRQKPRRAAHRGLAGWRRVGVGAGAGAARTSAPAAAAAPAASALREQGSPARRPSRLPLRRAGPQHPAGWGRGAPLPAPTLTSLTAPVTPFGDHLPTRSPAGPRPSPPEATEERRGQHRSSSARSHYRASVAPRRRTRGHRRPLSTWWWHRSSRRDAGPAGEPGRGTVRGGGGSRPPATPTRRGPLAPSAAVRPRHPARPPLRPCRYRYPALWPDPSARGVRDAHGDKHPPSPRPDLTGRARCPRPPGRTSLRAGLRLPYAAPQPASLLHPQPH